MVLIDVVEDEEPVNVVRPCEPVLHVCYNGVEIVFALYNAVPDSFRDLSLWDPVCIASKALP
jgi:hypothetical protein